MKIPSDELFLLVRSMSKQEKRYFRIYAETFSGKQRNYIRLFSAIDKQKKVYDEKEIKRLFEGENNLLDNFPSIKSQLYDLVLKSLKNYSRDSSIGMELSDILKDIEILFNKTLYLQCLKVIVRAKKIAYVHEQFEHLLNLLKWQRKIGDVNSDMGKHKIDADKINREEINILGLMDNMRLYRDLSERMYKSFIGSGVIRNSVNRLRFKKMMHNHLLKDISKALTIYSKLSFYYIHSFYFFLTEKVEKCIGQLEARIELLEKKPHLLKVYSAMYYTTLTNMLNIMDTEKYYNRFFEVLNKLRSTAGNSEAIQIKLFETTYPPELRMYLKMGDFEKGIKVIDTVIKGVVQYGEKMDKNRKPILFFNIACVYFGVKDYKNSRKWINAILDFADENPRVDIQCIARILNLIIYFEQNASVSVEHYIRATYRFLTKEKHLYKVENLLLNFISIVFPGLNGHIEQMQGYKELQKQLIRLSKNKFEAGAFAYFDFISWIESKIENRPFAEVVREKARLVNS